jgi:hypothetical protein
MSFNIYRCTNAKLYTADLVNIFIFWDFNLWKRLHCIHCLKSFKLFTPQTVL